MLFFLSMVRDVPETNIKVIDELEETFSEDELKHYYWTQKERYSYILKELGNLNKKTILDIGCFPCHLSLCIKRLYNANVIGISYAVDYNKKTNLGCSVKERLERARKEGVNNVLSNINSGVLPFKKNCFDIVLCTEVIEHLIKPPVAVLEEINRVLKPRGVLILTTPNFARVRNRLKLLFGQHIVDYDDFYREFPYYGHKREFTMNELKILLSKTGFKIVKSDFCNFGNIKEFINLYGLKLHIFNYLLDYLVLLPSFRKSIFIKAIKL